MLPVKLSALSLSPSPQNLNLGRELRLVVSKVNACCLFTVTHIVYYIGKLGLHMYISRAGRAIVSLVKIKTVETRQW